MARRIPDPCSVVRANPHPGHGTVLVLGTPRGGTSVVAGICHMLGIPMGLNIDPSNVEDRRFRELRHSPDRVQGAATFFERLRCGRDIAGVKDPTLADWIDECYPQVPEPVLVVVSRDVYATAQREECSGNDLFASLQEAIRRKFGLLDFVEPLDSPLIVLSYERLILDPRRAVVSLANFLVGDVSDDLVMRTAALVQPHADMPNDVNFLAARREYELAQALQSA
jgi:hypothetical protein